jgi:transcriptional regulator with XRE-family HTH domain
MRGVTRVSNAVKTPLAQAIVALRAVTRMTQPQLASFLDVSVRSIVRFERDAEPPIYALELLAELAHGKGIPHLAGLFEKQLNERRKQLVPALDSGFLERSDLKHIRVQDLDRLGDLLCRVIKDWESIKPAIRPAMDETNFGKERICELKHSIQKGLKQMKELINTYESREAEIAPSLGDE